jgi:hypothetical protein
MKWNSMLGSDHERGMGGYAEAFYTDKIVDHVDSDPDFLRRYPYRVIGAFGKGWDRPKTLTDEFITVAKAKTTPQRQVIVSNRATSSSISAHVWHAARKRVGRPRQRGSLQRIDVEVSAQVRRGGEAHGGRWQPVSLHQPAHAPRQRTPDAHEPGAVVGAQLDGRQPHRPARETPRGTGGSRQKSALR